MILKPVVNVNHCMDSNLQSSRFILTAFIFKHIFVVIGPLNKILQSRDLDVLAAVNYLKKWKKINNNAYDAYNG